MRWDRWAGCPAGLNCRALFSLKPLKWGLSRGPSLHGKHTTSGCDVSLVRLCKWSFPGRKVFESAREEGVSQSVCFSCHGWGHIVFLGLLWQMTVNWAAYSDEDLSAHDFGGQESETRVLAGPHSVQRLSGESFLLAAPDGTLWLCHSSLYPCLLVTVPSSFCVSSVSVLVWGHLSLDFRCTSIMQDDLILGSFT